MDMPNVTIPEAQIADFCRRHHIRKLALFGSVLRDDFRPDSDIDVLVDFEGRATPRLSEHLAMEAELREIFQHDIDLVEQGILEQSQEDERRNNILRTARVIYERE